MIFSLFQPSRLTAPMKSTFLGIAFATLPESFFYAISNTIGSCATYFVCRIPERILMLFAHCYKIQYLGPILGYFSLPINSYNATPPLSYIYALVGNGGGGSRTLLYPIRQDCCDYAVFLSSLAGISIPLISISVAMCSFHSAIVVFGLQI